MLYDSEAMRRFARIDPLQDTVPDETIIMQHPPRAGAAALTAQMFGAVRTLLAERMLLIKAGTIVVATIIGAPRITRNATQ
jgi:hypothetical protein